MKSKYSSMLMLLGAALFWGTAFVAQSIGARHVGPFTFNGTRNLVGAVILLPAIFLWHHIRGRMIAEGKAVPAKRPPVKGEWHGWPLIGGAVCGFFLFIANNLQQTGIAYTTVGKSGFITAMYIVIVPLLGIFFKKKPGLRLWISVALAVVGLYLLCMKEKLTLGFGDFLMLLCAVAFAVQIMAVDYYSPRSQGLKLASMEFLTCGILSSICALIFEHPTTQQIAAAILPILYAGCFSCGIAYTLQILGQKDIDPTVGSLIMSLESVVSLIAGWLILGESMSLRELCGCVVMFAAIILAQFPEKGRR